MCYITYIVIYIYIYIYIYLFVYVYMINVQRLLREERKLKRDNTPTQMTFMCDETHKSRE
jgi:hypothetical protein